MNERPLVSVERLVKRYGATVALRDVSLRVDAATIVLLLGPNGAGKTTLLRVLATATRPSAGGGQVLGHTLGREAERIRAQVALVTHASMLYEDLSALENLQFAASMLGQRRGRAELVALLERIGLGRWAEVPVRAYSNGMKRRVSLARAMLAQPRLLLLDEPYVGLDAQGVAAADGFAREVRASGGSVLLATHELDRGVQVADRALMLEAGRVVQDVPDPRAGHEALVARYVAGGT